jgi:hypothetical protein
MVVKNAVEQQTREKEEKELSSHLRCGLSSTLFALRAAVGSLLVLILVLTTTGGRSLVIEVLQRRLKRKKRSESKYK